MGESEVAQSSNSLKLEDISCGSSLSSESGSDEEFFNGDKFKKMREKKQFLHKLKKLMTRTMAAETGSVRDPKIVITAGLNIPGKTKTELKVVTKRSDDSSSSDDLFDNTQRRVDKRKNDNSELQLASSGDKCLSNLEYSGTSHKVRKTKHQRDELKKKTK